MANRSCRGQNSFGPEPSRMEAACPEPPVRRWPHPLPQPEAAPPEDPTQQFIRCALAYQNELLSEIKALLERLIMAEEEKEKEED